MVDLKDPHLSLSQYTAAVFDSPDMPPRIYKPNLTPPADQGKPPAVSPAMRAALDDLFSVVHEPADERIIASAMASSEGTVTQYQRAAELDKIARHNTERADAIRDAYRGKDVMTTPRDAIDRLNAIGIQEKFLVLDSMAHNMQALLSKRNQRENGKRFKSARVNGPNSHLQVWRTR